MSVLDGEMRPRRLEAARAQVVLWNPLDHSHNVTRNVSAKELYVLRNVFLKAAAELAAPNGRLASILKPLRVERPAAVPQDEALDAPPAAGSGHSDQMSLIWYDMIWYLLHFVHIKWIN